MKTWLLIDDNDIVQGSVVWDGDPNIWQPPEGFRVVPTIDGHWRYGHKYDHVKQCAYDPNPEAGNPRVIT